MTKATMILLWIAVSLAICSVEAQVWESNDEDLQANQVEEEVRFLAYA